MKKAMAVATETAARTGTRMMAGLPSSPPRTADKNEVGSTVAAEMVVDGMVKSAAVLSKSGEGRADMHDGLHLLRLTGGDAEGG